MAWQWAADLPWLEAKPSGPVMTVGVLLAGAAVYGLHWLGDRNRVSDFEVSGGSLAQESQPRTGLKRYEFFHVGRKSQPILGRLHLSAGWSVVSLIGALTWQTIDNHSTSLSESAFQHLVWLASLTLLIAVTLVVTAMGDPEAALECQPPDLVRRPSRRSRSQPRSSPAPR